MTGEPPQAVQGGSQNGDRVQPGSSLSAGQQGLPKGPLDSLLPPTTQQMEPRPCGPRGARPPSGRTRVGTLQGSQETLGSLVQDRFVWAGRFLPSAPLCLWGMSSALCWQTFKNWLCRGLNNSSDLCQFLWCKHSHCSQCRHGTWGWGETT